MNVAEFLIVLLVFDIWRKVANPDGFLKFWATLLIYLALFIDIFQGVLK